MTDSARQHELDRLNEVDPREDKLPRWAFDTINSLRRALKTEAQRADAARLATDPHGSSAILDRFDGVPVGLGANAVVTFRLPDGYEIQARVKDGMLELTGSPGRRGHAALVVAPWVTNAVRVFADPRR